LELGVPRHSIPDIWTKDPLVLNFAVIDDMNYVKPEFAKAADPYIVVKAPTFTSGGVHHVIDHWEEEVGASQQESGTLAFRV
jgi:hypothetical protein